MKRFATGVLVVLLAATAARAGDQVKVGAAWSSSDLPLLFALDKGYFRDEGLDVEAIHFDSGAKMVAPLATGDLDVSGGATSAAFFNAAERGIGIRIVANRSAMAPGYRYQTVVVRSDLVESGKFKTYADFKGMKIALPASGIGSQVDIDAMAKRGGIAYEDIEQVYLNFGQIVVGLRGKAIDGALMIEPYGSATANEGLGTIIDTTQDLFPNEEISFVFFGDKFARERPDVGKRYLKALLRGARDYNDAITDGRWNRSRQADDAARLLSKAVGMMPDQVRASFPQATHPDGAIDLAPLRKVLEFFKARGVVTSKSVTVEQVVDMSFAEAAVRDLGPYVRKSP
jgi:NitT/TauT family transport system substrate-binding protein